VSRRNAMILKDRRKKCSNLQRRFHFIDAILDDFHKWCCGNTKENNAAPEHFATLQPAQKTEFKLQTQRRNHAPIHDNTQLLPRLIRELHHHPTEIREISLPPPKKAPLLGGNAH
jgi:hypothetical protein